MKNLSYLALILVVGAQIEAGIIKDIFQKVTNTNNKTEDVVKQSVPVCGSSLFSTPDENALSPEMIFITGRGSDSKFTSSRTQKAKNINEVAQEYRFNVDNVTLDDLQRYGFNRDAPVTILMHGFTSGYPLQGWMTGIVEAYTINRETNSQNGGNYNQNNNYNNYNNNNNYDNDDRNNNNSDRDRYSGNSNNSNDYRRNQSRNRRLAETSSQSQSGIEPRRSSTSNNQRNNYDQNSRNEDRYSNSSNSGRRNNNERNNYGNNNNYGIQSSSSTYDRPRENYSNLPKVPHNLFIINWNYAARGILYPRAVANIPIVASYATRFVNRMLLDEARIDPGRIQLVGHSLGAHLAGFIGKNTKSKVGRIYGLDPAGPCFGAYTGFLYPKSKRLAPSDAQEVITIQTNSALLGHEKPLGYYSVYVEGGEVQPGCKGGGVLKSLGTLTWDGGDFDTVACSHSRAPNLLTYSYKKGSNQDSCEMIGYECKDWKSFTKGFCGVCREDGKADSSQTSPVQPVRCIRIGLDWQYSKTSPQNSGSSDNNNYGGSGYDDYRNPQSNSNQDREYDRNNQRNNNNRDRDNQSYNGNRPTSSNNWQRQNNQRNRRATSNQTRSDRGGDVTPILLYMKTSDTQPYCIYHYQIILELNEPFKSRDPPMTLILQDSENSRDEQGTLSTDEFGNKFDDRTYTHLLTSANRLGRIDHATILLRDGLPQGSKVLKALHVNHMSNSDPKYRQRLSTRLCPVENDDSRGKESTIENTRFYFEPCRDRNDRYTSNSNSNSNYSGNNRNNQRRP